MKISMFGVLLLMVSFMMMDSSIGAPEAKGPTGADEARLMKIIQGDLGTATNEVERFYALNRAAKNALKADNKEDARKFANELARLATAHTNDWNYGNAIQDSNQVLGLISLSEDNVAEAKKHLLASADSKGSPQMNSFGPNMRLAQALLARGEKDVVLEYFTLCGKFWKMGTERLAQWSELVEKGETPKFGGNLEY